MRTELTIVVPLLGANRELDQELERLGQSLIKFSISAEVVIVATSDRFHLEFEKYEEISSKSLLKIRAITSESHVGKNGLGQLLRLGNALADSRYVFFLILEGKYDPDFLPRALTACRRGSPLVIANRFHKQNQEISGARQSFFQQKTFRNLFRIFRILLPQDSTNSTRLFDKRIFDALAISGNGWDMLAEQTIKTQLVGEKIDVIDSNIPTFTREGDFKLPTLDLVFGLLRLSIRSLFHKLSLPWF